MPIIADWIEPFDGSSHNFDSASAEGTNRFATLLLYLSEVEDGGETLFTEAGAYHSEDDTEVLPYDDGEVRVFTLHHKSSEACSWTHRRVLVSSCLTLPQAPLLRLFYL